MTPSLDDDYVGEVLGVLAVVALTVLLLARERGRAWVLRVLAHLP